ncbi:uncharacterized protein ANIA_11373 [Aspergillus nidulans FGSC A4]|uniref:Uncharacterized protein n=1 Tax=Emericella nidulans (strain FGSC A4 / ATCC 38163 / CBS 112.46 / NRRL 194 / M139) TaxID=227321 RepID=C8VJ70_EMENI|nr:hypothetical protein [Aspergillus nidulans FGSC A4]CBF83762.1 TPA: hypothetical protein ANIA_11373 [Aspergillus nidulans FGSC A4]
MVDRDLRLKGMTRDACLRSRHHVLSQPRLRWTTRSKPAFKNCGGRWLNMALQRRSWFNSDTTPSPKMGAKPKTVSEILHRKLWEES